MESELKNESSTSPRPDFRRDDRRASGDGTDPGGGAGRRWLAAGTCAGIVALGVLGYLAVGRFADDPEPGEPGPQGPLVEVEAVRRVERLTVAQTGFVRAAERLTLSAEVSGRVARVAEAFREGRRIGAGDVVVELDRKRFEVDVRAAEARVAGTRARRDTAASDADRQRSLDDDGFGVEQTLERSEATLASADADVALARSALELARIALDDASIRAPYDAIVSERDVSLGQIVGPGTSVGELVLASRAEIHLGLLPRQRALLEPDGELVGRPVDVFPVNGARRPIATGRIAAIDPVLDPVARTLGVVIDVDDPFEGGALKVGELVEVVVPVSRMERATFDVPARALKGADRLWVVADGELRAVDPLVVRRDGNRVQVTSDGLADGDRVIVTDVATAVEGLAVRLAPESGEDGEGGGTAVPDGPEGSP